MALFLSLSACLLALRQAFLLILHSVYRRVLTFLSQNRRFSHGMITIQSHDQGKIPLKKQQILENERAEYYAAC